MGMSQRGITITTVLILLYWPSSLSAAAPSSCADADLLLLNGHIVTMESPNVVSSMAVRDGKVLAVGSDQELAGCVSARTNVVDMRKRTVLPGLIDVHTHAVEWTKGILRGQIDARYPKIHSISEIAQEVGERAGKLKPGEWIIGSAWDDAVSIATLHAKISTPSPRTTRSI
jgi:predicted amidohydrolase YtcJ